MTSIGDYRLEEPHRRERDTDADFERIDAREHERRDMASEPKIEKPEPRVLGERWAVLAGEYIGDVYTIKSDADFIADNVYRDGRVVRVQIVEVPNAEA